jgi:CTP:molybdopterin cytidylyltransferase MocA/SAM-dependent methyltransferase
MRIAGLILAAGSASRFGAPKLLASLDGRPLLEHTLEAARTAGLDPIVVVLGAGADTIEAGIAWSGEQRIWNPDPGRGLASTLQIGLAAIADLEPRVDAAIVLLGDQPRTDPAVIGLLEARFEAAGTGARSLIVVPRYAGGGGANPVLVGRSAFGLTRDARGDRGLGPLIDAHPDLVTEVSVEGENPDVDTPTDLARLVELAWAEGVRANRAQVERVREVPDGLDFYRPMTSLFRADPGRTGDPVLDALLAIVKPADTVLDIGAGPGRYALPLALATREVIAIDPSESGLAALRESMTQFGIANVRPIKARWPPDADDRVGAAGLAELGEFPVADVALIAHVGYDIDAIGPFIDAMEMAARRSCVAVLMERSPASLAEPFWREVHGEERVRLPALAEFVELLGARGRGPEMRIVDSERRSWTSRAELEAYLRRQTWTAPGGELDRRLMAAIERRATVAEDGTVSLGEASSLSIGIVVWAAPGPSAIN